MKLLKRIAPLCLVLACVMCLAFALTACGDDGADGGNNGGNPPCTHTEQATIAEVPATCTTEGMTEGKSCTACGVVTVAPQTVPALGHKDTDENGICDVCETVICEHTNTEVSVPGTPADCTTDGKTDEYKCSDCGEITTQAQIIPAIGHEDADEDGKCDECGEDMPKEGNIYTVTVLDKDGNPIAGVKFNLSAMGPAGLINEVLTTDENGKIQYDKPEGLYFANVSINSSPADYSEISNKEAIELSDNKNIIIETTAVKLIAYEIIVVDESGNKVEGVQAQVCFDKCRNDYSDENGRIVIYIDPAIASNYPAKASVIGSEYTEVDGHNGENYKYYDQDSKTITLTVRPNN